METVLRIHGNHAIYIARDGAEAVEKAKQCKTDVIFLDIALPIVTGLDVARMLSDQGDKKPLLIAISGYGTSEDRAAAYKAGFDHFFTKPVGSADLLHILEKKENYLFITKREPDSKTGHP